MITYHDISTALMGIGVIDAEKILHHCRKIDKMNAGILNKRYLLSEEESALITTYTYGGKDDSEPPCTKLNRALWSDDYQGQFSNAKSYLRILLRALRKLPRTVPTTLYRGIKNDNHEYNIGEELMWKGFSTVSPRMRQVRYFLMNTKTGNIEGTLFEIRGTWGYNVSDFSMYRAEQGQ